MRQVWRLQSNADAVVEMSEWAFIVELLSDGDELSDEIGLGAELLRLLRAAEEAKMVKAMRIVWYLQHFAAASLDELTFESALLPHNTPEHGGGSAMQASAAVLCRADAALARMGASPWPSVRWHAHGASQLAADACACEPRPHPALVDGVHRPRSSSTLWPTTKRLTSRRPSGGAAGRSARSSRSPPRVAPSCAATPSVCSRRRPAATRVRVRVQTAGGAQHARARRLAWQVRADTLEFLRDAQGRLARSALAVARILYGVGSPCHPATDWRRHAQWASQADMDFMELLQIVQRAWADHASMRLADQLRERGLVHMPDM